MNQADSAMSHSPSDRTLLPISIPPAAISELCQQYHIHRLAICGSVLRDDF
jgi:hypothetical protein